MPAVSTRRTRCRPNVTVCSTVSRVVPGMSVTMTNLQCAVGDTAVFDIKPLLLKGIEVVYR